MAVAIAAGLALLPSGAARATGPQPINIGVSGTNGVGSIVNPGLPCASGGEGNYRDFLIDTPITGQISSSLPGHLRANLDVQHDGVEPPTGPTLAFLLGSQSHATMSNQRGAVEFQLSSGTCKSPSLPFDGTTVGPGAGSWAIVAGSAGDTGSYTGAQGSGTFTLKAMLGPGAANTWTLGLTGNITVQEPALTVGVVEAYWGNLGLDYATRIVSVTYQITNSGKGDAFGVSLTGATSSASGVTATGGTLLGAPLGPLPQSLGDLAAGASTQVTVRYQLGLLSPCQLVILGCKFPTTLTASLPDALDVPASASASASVTAPNFPPPASEGL